MTRPFDLDDARLASLFGDQVAAALLTAEAFEQQRHAALHDSLTGLPNRILLADRVQQAILVAKRDGAPVALLVLDLDRFKDVNDTLGHAAGDALLQAVGGRMASVLRTSDTIARLGGDEFAVLLPNTGADGASLTGRALVEAIDQPFIQDSRVIEVGLSIGAAIFPEHGDDAATLLRHADVAMYIAKRADGGCTVYTPQQGEQSRDRLTRLGELRQAIGRGELSLHYQPKIQCSTSRVVGAEALVRWQHPRHGLLGPDAFIPLAEQSTLIKQLTQWVLEAAIEQCRGWRTRGIE
jgi:diguanylate cyclase (GGDEF)-like protein